MGLVSRLQLQRSSLLALVTGIIFGTATGWLPISTSGIVGALALSSILLPMQYTFTTQGIALGEGIFYPWSGFSGFVTGKKSLKLNHPTYFGCLTLFVKPADMTSVLQYVDRYVQKNRFGDSISEKGE